MGWGVLMMMPFAPSCRERHNKTFYDIACARVRTFKFPFPPFPYPLRTATLPSLITKRTRDSEPAFSFFFPRSPHGIATKVRFLRYRALTAASLSPSDLQLI
jgi:hypothetical protein